MFMYTAIRIKSTALMLVTTIRAVKDSSPTALTTPRVASTRGGMIQLLYQAHPGRRAAIIIAVIIIAAIFGGKSFHKAIHTVICLFNFLDELAPASDDVKQIVLYPPLPALN
jgi:type IV secretory pathway VirB2 component (pilin)